MLVVDDVERLIGFSPVGPVYSNAALQVLLARLRKPLPAGRRMLVLGTTSNLQAMEALGAPSPGGGGLRRLPPSSVPGAGARGGACSDALARPRSRRRRRRLWRVPARAPAGRERTGARPRGDGPLRPAGGRRRRRGPPQRRAAPPAPLAPTLLCCALPLAALGVSDPCNCWRPPVRAEEVPIRHLAALVDVATAAGGSNAHGDEGAGPQGEHLSGGKPRLTLRQFATTLSQLVRAVTLPWARHPPSSAPACCSRKQPVGFPRCPRRRR